MFKRKSQEKAKPLNSLMLQVQEYVASEGKEVDTVIGVDLEGKKYSVILTTSGEAAENENRNDIASFTNSKSNHHVPVGGMIHFNTVWLRDPAEEGGPVTGIAKWAEFFGNSRDELSVGNAMYRAGVNVDDKGKETRWGALDRLGKPMALTVDQFPGAVSALADKCAADRSRARPIIRLLNSDGEVLDFTSIKQGTAEVEENGEKVRRAENGAQVVEGMKKNTRLTKILQAVEAGQGVLEMIPVMSIEMSKKMMNSPRGKNYVALAKRFQDENQDYAAECYIRRAPSDDFNYISHLSVTNKDRFDPLLLPSDRFPQPAYSAKLLAEVGVDPEKVKGKAPQAEPEPEPHYENAPGFDN
ncbi:hypothetical protein [Stutzerimonas chloritidismutans]